MDQAAAAQDSRRHRNQPAGSGQTAVAYATAVADEPRGSELAGQPSAMYDDGSLDDGEGNEWKVMAFLYWLFKAEAGAPMETNR